MIISAATEAASAAAAAAAASSEEAEMPPPRAASSSSSLFAHARRREVLARALLLSLALSLQGCVLDIPRHTVGYWEQETPYLLNFQVPGNATQKTQKQQQGPPPNSCTLQDLEESQRCNGHGSCKEWFGALKLDSNQTRRSLSFCACDTYWAGPECGTLRKSQYTAYFLAIFFGFLGADQFYLGWWVLGTWKAVTLGLLGGWVIRDMLGSLVSYDTRYLFIIEWETFKTIVLCIVLPWYVFDIVSIGSTEVYTADRFRVANDIPRYAFVISLLALMGFYGFAVSIWSIQRQRAHKAREMLLLRAEAAQTFGFTSGSRSQRRRWDAWPSYSSSKSFASTNYGGFDYGYGALLPARPPSPPRESVVLEAPRSAAAAAAASPSAGVPGVQRRFLDASAGLVRANTPPREPLEPSRLSAASSVPQLDAEGFSGYRADHLDASPSGRFPTLPPTLQRSGGGMGGGSLSFASRPL